jgi:hypothetical protein
LSWWVWWAAQQPDRKVLDDGTLAAELGQASKVRVSGLNSIITAIAWLAFWGRSKLMLPQSQLWKKAVLDVIHIIRP